MALLRNGIDGVQHWVHYSWELRSREARCEQSACWTSRHPDRAAPAFRSCTIPRPPQGSNSQKKPSAEQGGAQTLTPAGTGGREGNRGKQARGRSCSVQGGTLVNSAASPVCWREGRKLSSSPQVLATSKFEHNNHESSRELPASPAQGGQSSLGLSPISPPAHAPNPVATQALHLQDLLLDPHHQDLGASRDFGVGQQDPERRHPASDKTRSASVLRESPAAPRPTGPLGAFS